MTDPAALQKLLTWLSPAFPVGAFAWSAGLETAIVDGRLTTRASVEEWLIGTLTHGGARTDAILMAQAYDAVENANVLRDLADLCLALTPARERHDETTITGDAFAKAASAWPSPVYARLPQSCPYPIAVGAIAAAHGVDKKSSMLAFLTALAHGQVSVAVRLIPIGQSDGLAIMAALEPRILALVEACQHATLDDIGSIAYAADIAQMRHETLTTRIFRS